MRRYSEALTESFRSLLRWMKVGPTPLEDRLLRAKIATAMSTHSPRKYLHIELANPVDVIRCLTALGSDSTIRVVKDCGP